jgi:hypothetical protein
MFASSWEIKKLINSGTSKQVLSAYFNRTLIDDKDCKLHSCKIYEVGPITEPWIILLFIALVSKNKQSF